MIKVDALGDTDGDQGPGSEVGGSVSPLSVVIGHWEAREGEEVRLPISVWGKFKPQCMQPEHPWSLPATPRQQPEGWHVGTPHHR